MAFHRKAEGLTPDQSAAVAAGFPKKYIDLVEPILSALNQAVAASSVGDIPAEEACIKRAERLATSVGTWSLSGAVRATESAIQKRVDAGQLRRGAKLIADLSEHTIKGLYANVTAANLYIFTDRIVYGDKVYLMSPDVHMTVEVNGQQIVTTRPTMTRMAMGSALPGSALIVGLATAKKQTTDLRTAGFSLVHPEWRIVHTLDPNRAHEVSGVAAQVNALSESMKPTAQPASAGLADELSKLASPRDAGVLTGEEFEAAKARLLS